MTTDVVRAILGIIVSLSLGFIMVPISKKIAIKYGAIDTPDERKIHKGNIPRFGGISIVTSFYVGLIIAFGLNRITTGIILSSLFIVVAGIIDDIKGITPKVKLIFQFMGAIFFVVYASASIDGFTLVDKIEFGKLSIVITVIWLVGSSNAVNLIDGLDGLAAGVSFIACVILGIISLTNGENEYAVVSFILCVSIIGFWKANFNPASIFMGDTGSLFLGYLIGVLSILGALKEAAIITLALPVLVLGVPIFDSTFAIFRRIKNKKKIFDPDKDHLHHRLLKSGLSQKTAVLFVYCISLTLGLTALLVKDMLFKYSISIVITVVILIYSLFMYLGLMDTGEFKTIKLFFVKHLKTKESEKKEKEK